MKSVATAIVLPIALMLICRTVELTAAPPADNNAPQKSMEEIRNSLKSQLSHYIIAHTGGRYGKRTAPINAPPYNHVNIQNQLSEWDDPASSVGRSASAAVLDVCLKVNESPEILNLLFP